MNNEQGSPNPLLITRQQKGGSSLRRVSRGDIVASTLEYYRERTKNDDYSVPKPYQEIKKKIQKIIEEGKKVLVDIKDSYSVQTIVLQFEHVNDRWAMGYSICYTEEGETKVPYTIHFSDIYCKRLNIKVIVEGENPFGSKRG